MFLPNWFVRRRGLAIGIAFSGVGVGSIVMMPWLQTLIASGGWRRACWTAAAVVALTLVPLNLLQRRRPEDLGLRPDGDAAVTDAAARAHPANVVDPAWASTDWTLARAVRTARFWWIALGFLSGLFTWYAVQVHQTKYLIDIGFQPGLAAWALGLVGFAGIAGQIGLGYLSDRIGREWVWTLSSIGFALCYTALLVMRYYPTPALLYAMVGVQGLLGYGLASVYSAIPAEIFQGRHYGDGLRHAVALLDRRRRAGPLGRRHHPRRHRQLRTRLLGRDGRERHLGRRDVARCTASRPRRRRAHPGLAFASS